MSRFRFHKVAAIAVLVATGAWMLTGEFSSVGSAAPDEADRVVTEARTERPPRLVAVVDAPRVVHARTIQVSGRTEANQRAVLAARVAGIVQELPVRQGENVEAGDLVMRLDTEGKEAAVETARQLLAQRETEFAATERLVDSGNLPRLQLDNARSALASARSQLEAAEAEVGRFEVRAPFPGIVDRVRPEVGSSVSQGAEIATLIRLDPIIAVGEVSERDVGFVSRGQPASVRLVDGRVIDGEIRFVSRDASPQTRTFRVEVAIPNPDAEIPAGMTAEITLRAQPVESVMLPRSVITLSAQGDLGIRGVDSSETVVFHPIDLVDDTPSGLYLAGIPASVRIIVAGQELVTEGERVNAVPADEDTIRRLVGEFRSSDAR
ncbi:MAG: efflux RND transporter periplasmic adaptor subunit [Aliihoeflea sp.]